MHDGMPYGRNQGQGQGHSREVDRQSPTGLIFLTNFNFPSGTVWPICAESAVKLKPTSQPTNQPTMPVWLVSIPLSMYFCIVLQLLFLHCSCLANKLVNVCEQRTALRDTEFLVHDSVMNLVTPTTREASKYNKFLSLVIICPLNLEGHLIEYIPLLCLIRAPGCKNRRALFPGHMS